MTHPPSPLTRLRNMIADYERETGIRCQLAALSHEAYTELMADVSVLTTARLDPQGRHVWIDGVMVKPA